MPVRWISARGAAVPPWRVEREHGGRLLSAPLGDDSEHALRRLWTTITAENLTGHTHVVAFGGVYAPLAAPVLSALLGAPLVTLLRGNDIDVGVFSMRRRGAGGRRGAAETAGYLAVLDAVR